MTSPLIDPAHIDELEWPALRPGGEDVPAIDDTDAVGTMRRDLAAAEAERDAAQADLRERVLRAGGYAIQLAEAEAHIKALHAKLDALAPHGSCGCSYDTPGQVCQHHSPQLVAALARAEKAEAQLAAVNKTLRACWGEDLGALLARATAAEAEVPRLTTRAEKAEAERDAAVIDLGEQAENFREVLDAELTRSEKAEAEVSRLTSLIDEAAEALLDATANLAGAASAYRKYACRSRTVGRGVADPFFTTRASDFDAAVERARALLPRLKEPSRAE